MVAAPRPNWFVAIPIQGRGLLNLPDPPGGFRRLHSDDLHLTIAFLGPIDASAAHTGFDAFAWPLGPTRATLSAVVPMGPEGRYSALSALLDSSRTIVEAAMNRSRAAVFEASGAAPERRPAKAHITLARPTRSCRDREAGLNWANSLDLSGVSVNLDRVALYTWSEDRSTRMFQIVKQAVLG